ncbi:oligosaccharide flippase family protein [Kangiella sediminilitoris]|uniref:Polysaccharide biosynthesis protein n=1 Tax=Kangiella sediminilitoris TaxID=1144748 RepID=A0A1B3BBJ8_9GAMM|nr:oligosaccharide flippase family protein [Kangiella sediminilitoris]AOE50164.1 hypothetical protein KS2013_1452 [Kangiella sediminilitoris]
MLTKVIVFLFNKGIAYGGTLLLTLYITYIYGVEVLGEFSLAYSALLGIGIITRFGSETYIIKHIPNINIDKKTIYFNKISNNSLYVSLLFISIFIPVIYFSSLPSEYLWLLFCLPFHNLNMLYSSLLKAEKRANKAPYFENGGVSLLSIILLATLFTLDLKSKEYLYIAYFISIIIVSVFMYLGFSRRYRASLFNKFLGGLYLSLFRETKDFLWINFASYCILWLPIFLLSIFSTAYSVGAYTIVTRLAFIFNFILVGMTTILMPYISQYFQEGKMDKLESVSLKLSSILTLLGLVILLAFIFWGEYGLSFFTEQPEELYIPLLIVSAAQLINLTTGSVGVLMSVSNLQHILKKIILLSGFLGIVTSILLIPMYGTIGACFGFGFSLAFKNISAAYYSKKVNKINSSLISYIF